MRTVTESLQGINAYPIPQRTLDTIMTRRGLSGGSEATKEVIESDAFTLARADVLIWLSRAPNVSQGGQSYSFSDDERKQFRLEAGAIYADLEPDGDLTRIKYGYRGDRL
jgi:hypothetical protein